MIDFSEFEDAGFLIEDYLTKEKWSIGSTGGVISSFKETRGTLEPIAQNPQQFNFIISYDCPFLFPLSSNHSGQFDYENRSINYFHFIKKRGQQRFSSLDILKLPKFSAIKIVVSIIPEDIIILENGFVESNLDEFSWKLISFINNKINDVIEKPELKINIRKNKILSYVNSYCTKVNENLIAQTKFPYTSAIYINEPKSTDNIDEDVLKLYLQNKIKLASFIEEYLPTVQVDQNFEKIVFRVVHDYAYFTSERPESLFKLNEELIRDLFLIALKVLLPYSDAEVFNYDGKLDFKVINPLNYYEQITGEFKVWSGVASFNECINQITEKHSTGAEKEVYMLFINRNKKVEETYQKSLEMLKSDSHYISEINPNISISSNQYFSKHKVRIKTKEINLILGIIDTYYERK